MCGAMVGCGGCEGYAFFIKNARLLNLQGKYLFTKLMPTIQKASQIYYW